MIESSVVGSRIVVDGVPKYSPTFSSIPGSRWNRRAKKWTYPVSPFVAVRLRIAARRLDEPIAMGAGMPELLEDWERIKEAQVWKTADGDTAAAKAVTGDSSLFYDSGLRTNPWRHQVSSHAFIHDMKAAYLALDMGCGKSLVTLIRMLELKPSLTLIVCPKGVIEVWPQQMEEHIPDMFSETTVVELDAAGSERKAERIDSELRAMAFDGMRRIFIINYESMWRDAVAKRLLAMEWDLCVMDEIHKIKSASGKASKFAARLSAKCHYRIGLSGTPLPNNRLDAFGQYRFLDPGIFGTNYSAFRARYAQMGGYGGYEVVGWKNESQFNKLINYITFRVDKSILDLPPLTHVKRYVQLPAGARDTYADLAKAFTTDVDAGLVTAANALSRLVKLREVTSGFVITDDGEEQPLHSAKKDALMDLFEDLPEDEKVVIFHMFNYEREDIIAACDSVGRNYGVVSGDRKDTQGGRFPPGVNVLVCQTKAGGLGLNLTDARYEIFYSVDFNLADHDQAESRVHRGGQDKPVTCVHLICDGTVDEVVYQALESKRNVVTEIMNYVKTGGRI